MGGVFDFGFCYTVRFSNLSFSLVLLTSFVYFTFRIIRVGVIREVQPLHRKVILLAKVLWFFEIIYLCVVEAQRHRTIDIFSLIPDPRFIQIEFGSLGQEALVQERVVQLNR